MCFLLDRIDDVYGNLRWVNAYWLRYCTVQVIRDDAVDPGAMICVSAKVTL